jgi:superfamily I DNA/RNA helicase
VIDARWDSIIVDEGQDFREYWWLAIEKLLSSLVDNIPSLWVFYDPHQDIYGADGLRLLNMPHATLTRNCRNTARIAEHAFGEIGEAPHLHETSPAGVPVELIQCANDVTMKDAVRRTLHRLVSEEKLDPQRIVILTARAADKSLLKGATLGNLKVVDWPAANSNEVGYCSLQRFKGLEADAVILCEVDRSKANGTSRHLYVATSRAKHVLVVIEYVHA